MAEKCVWLDCRDAKVESVEKFGLFVEILPGKTGLLHLSELDTDRTASLDDWKAGDSIDVKLLEVICPALLVQPGTWKG